jgi:hypothetical protein
MTTHRCAIAALAISVLLLGAARAQDQLLPFRDPNLASGVTNGQTEASRFRRATWALVYFVKARHRLRMLTDLR